MKCPYCQNQMEKGNIPCADGINKVKWRSTNNENEVTLMNPNTTKKLFSSKKIEKVYYCSQCFVILKKIESE